MIRELTEAPNVGPKYKRIYEQLYRALTNRDYLPGSRLPSENELVERFSASRPTVSRALAQLENEGLVERRAGSGTFVRVQNRQRGFVFGLLIPGLGTTEIFEPICQGISIARVGGHHDLLWGTTSFSSGASEEDQAEQLCVYYLQRQVSGIFFAPLELTGRKDEVNQYITRSLDRAKVPLILLDRDIFAYPKRSRYDLVSIDNRRAGLAITNHLLERGARRLVFLARPNSAPTVTLRILGFEDALRFQPNLGATGWTEFGDPNDVSFIRSVFEHRNPDAFACANDHTAARLMTSLSGLGIEVPARVLVTGMDDIRYASVLQTPLTTIHQPCVEIGAAALAAMLDRISNPDMPARDCMVDFRLVVRKSTDPAS